jgi:mannose-6-phosphate isomerase-like protein (cupin superfamily)
VLKGRMRVRYADREVVVEAGDAYYMEPGHSPVLEAGTELVEFSPMDEDRKTMEVAERNFAAMQESR